MSDSKPDLGVRHRTRPTVGEQPDPIERLVRVLGPIEPGSLIVMDQRALGFPLADAEELTHVIDALCEVAGHRRLLVLMVPADVAHVQVLGPEEVSVPFRQVLAALTDDRDVVSHYSYDGQLGVTPAHSPGCTQPPDHAGVCVVPLPCCERCDGTGRIGDAECDACNGFGMPL